jgi:cupin fold WbuC family metalloprotein
MVSISDRWVAQSSEVLYPRLGTVGVTEEDIAALKGLAERNSRGRCRFCLHESASDRLHDMVIAFAPGVYDRPHKHHAKVETLIAIEGDAFYFRFSDDGRPISAQPISASGNNGALRILRTPIGEFHALLIHGGPFVFCESTLGPFDPAATEFALWSPASEDKSSVNQYLADLRKCTTTF